MAHLHPSIGRILPHPRRDSQAQCVTPVRPGLENVSDQPFYNIIVLLFFVFVFVFFLFSFSKLANV